MKTKRSDSMASPNIFELPHGVFVMSAFDCNIRSVCRFYVSKHDLEGKSKENLKMICHFIVTNYAPIWFNIWYLPSSVHGPKHIFNQMQQIKFLNFLLTKCKLL